VHTTSLCFNFNNWKKSTAKATFGLFPEREKKLMEEGDEKADTFVTQQKYELLLDLGQIY
jgi:hypothetical protein